MAVTLLSVRYQPTGAEVVLDDDGTERTFWKEGFKKADPVSSLTDWARDCVIAARAAEASDAAEADAEDADMNAQAFFTWMWQYRARPALREILRPVVRYYRRA